MWDLRDFALAAPTPTHGGSEVCQSVGRRMPVWLRPSAGAAAPLPCCIHALTCTHAPTRAYTSCPASSSALLVVRLLHCQSRPSRASPRRLSHPCCCVTLKIILYAPENGRNSFEWALLQIFRRCAAGLLSLSCMTLCASYLRQRSDELVCTQGSGSGSRFLLMKSPPLLDGSSSAEQDIAHRLSPSEPSSQPSSSNRAVSPPAN